MCPVGTQSCVFVNNMQQNTHLNKTALKVKANVKYIHVYSICRTKKDALPCKIASKYGK